METRQGVTRGHVGLVGILVTVAVVIAVTLGVTAVTTHILIDGHPADWEAYAVAVPDPRGDALGGIDIVGVAAISNSDSTYVLVLVEGNVSEIEQIDFDFNTDASGIPFIRASAKPARGEFHVTRQVDGEPVELEAIGLFAVAEAVELRLPLSAFDGTVPETVSLRLIDSEHGKKSPADITIAYTVLATAGTDLPFRAQANLSGADSLFCNCQDTSGSFAEASSIQVTTGYRAEYFIAPSGLNTPSDVAILPDGRMFVTSSRGGVVQQVLSDGHLETFAQGHVYAIDCDSEGNLYGYNFPTGEVFSLQQGAPMQRIARVPDTACESTLAVAPDGTLYIGHNACSGDTSGQSTLYRISSAGGEATVLTTQLQGISALDVDQAETLYATAGGGFYSVNTSTGSVTKRADLPLAPSFHGLVVDDEAGVYVSSGDFRDQGSIYQLALDGSATEIAHFSGNGIEGIAVTADGAVVGTQRSTGGLQQVDSDGTITALVEPNGLVSPHSLAFSPCGELVTVNDEGGRLTIACPDGENRSLIPMISFQPPQTHVAFSAQGWFICGESAPGFPSLLNLYLPNGERETLATDLDNVSGVAVGADGAVYASATGDGVIVRIEQDGTRRTIASGLEMPQALAVAPDGTVYAVTGGAGFGDVFVIPSYGNNVIAIAPNGTIHQLARIDRAAALALGPDGRLYVAAGSAVIVVDEWGTAWPFAQGFQAARGLTLDAEGRLYVADDDANAIVRIVPQS